MTNEELSPLMVSRSPGRMNSNSKLAGFYSFVPLEKMNQKQIEINQSKNVHKTLILGKDLGDNKNKMVSEKNLYKFTKNFDDDTDVNTDYSSHLNIKKSNTNAMNEGNKKAKPKTELSTKTLKKINSSIITSSKENPKDSEKNTNNQYIEHYNKLISVNSNLNIKTNYYNTINSPIVQKTQNNIIKYLNNNNNTNNTNINTSFETKSKKELQEFITVQLKNSNPNFSRVNMSGYGIQYLCSFLHKNPNNYYKEIKLLGCNINDDDLFMLTRTLLDHDIGLSVLNLSTNKITDDSASNILDILKDCKTLKGLSLYNNMISALLKDKLKEYVKLGRENYDIVQLYI